jgi:hypothetical protein
LNSTHIAVSLISQAQQLAMPTTTLLPLPTSLLLSVHRS